MFFIFIFLINIFSNVRKLNINIKEKDNVDYLVDKAYNKKNNFSFLLNKILSIFNKNLDDPKTFLSYSKNINNSKVEEPLVEDNYKLEDNYNPSMFDKVTSYIENTNKLSISEPEVYIYNTHQLETYSNEGLEGYNMTPNIMMAAYLLSDKLNSIGIKTITEDTNIYEFIKKSNFESDAFYKSTRIFVKNAKEKYPSLKLIIDLHRDSVDRNISVININNRNYARVLFVLGTTNENHHENEAIMKYLDAKINEKYNRLSRGIYEIETPEWRDSYNQDLGSEVILIELGGVNNNINEVINTVEVLSEAIKDYIGDIREK